MSETFKYAITRTPAGTFDRGITTANLGKPSYALALRQHRAYVEALKSIGLEVIELDPQPAYPDGHFVEDTAVVTPVVAVITNPGEKSRQGEPKSIAEVLAPYRQIEHIHAPGTLDGGDVLMIGNHFFIGISERTNPEGAQQLGNILEKYDYTWTLIPVGAGLHLKSSANGVSDHTLLVTRDFANHPEFTDYDRIVVDPAEAYAANTLRVNDHLIVPRGFPDTLNKLRRLGQKIIELDVSEMQKMDGGLTCLSIRF